VPTSSATGGYTIKIGLFSPGWGTLYHWNNSAGSITVSTGTASTATAVPTAKPTSTPVATVKPTNTPVATATPGGTGRYFSTLPVGAALPSDAECAAAVKRRPENKRVNATYNATRGNQTLPNNFLSGDPRVNTLTARVTGNFTGSTDEILQWTACKWGVDEDMVRAQAAIESWWRQSTKGDWTTNASNCAPGHGLGVDGQAGQCPESFGILQNRYPYEKGAWPGIDTSTAFNADTAYAIWRACYEGYEWWLNDVERGQQYAAGDAWGCMGRWFAGRWHTQPAEDYISRVKGYLSQRIWEQASFQEP
jgi:autotransporter family porin